MSSAHPPGWDPVAAARRRKAGQVRRYRAARDTQPDVYVTPFATTYPGGEVVESWAVVSESRFGDSCGIWHFPTKAEAVEAALAMGMAAP